MGGTYSKHHFTTTNSTGASKAFLDEWKAYTFPATLGFLAISLVYIRRKEPVVVDSTEDGNVIEYKRVKWENAKTYMYSNYVPFSLISTLWGKMNQVNIPSETLRVLMYKTWSSFFGCNLDEIDKELNEYRNLSEFFTRNLKDSARKLNMNENVIVSPVDGRVLSFGSISVKDINNAGSVLVEQIKGKTYNLRDLLGPFTENLTNNKKLNYIVFYLSPGDYHHYHSPYDFKVSLRRHFPGKLFPVKESFLQRINNLYGVNERIALLGDWAHGFFAYVAVGALNVGSMSLDFENSLRTNLSSNETSSLKYNSPVMLSKGERVGTFHLGSTIVLVFESNDDFSFDVSKDQVVKIGECVGATGRKKETVEYTYAPPWPKAQSA